MFKPGQLIKLKCDLFVIRLPHFVQGRILKNEIILFLRENSKNEIELLLKEITGPPPDPNIIHFCFMWKNEKYSSRLFLRDVPNYITIL